MIEFELNLTGAPGPRGPEGPAGGAPTPFTFSSSSSWTINHNLNRHVTVEVLDSAGRTILADVQESSLNQVIVSFVTPISGVALIS